jgi:MFS family permease
MYRTNLDWLNFLLADVRGGLGPYINVFLLTDAGWTQAAIGTVLTISGLLGICLHVPIGSLIDSTRHKRGLIIAGVWILSICGAAIAVAPTLPVVLAADVAMAALGAVFAPTVAAITLGLVGRAALPAQLGRNAAFDKAGNLFIAALAGAIGYLLGQRAVFFVTPFFAVLATFAMLSIPPGAIDDEKARGFEHGGEVKGEHAGGWRALLDRRPFLVLAAVSAVFHFANAPMLALASQKLALASPGRETVVTSAAIIVAQLATIPMALLVSNANWLGRKPLLLLAVSAVPLRGVLFAVIDDPFWIVALQVLDGVGAGLFDALLPLVLSDAVHGLGRYNLSRGVIGTVQGVGGASSYAFAGVLVSAFGYGVAFATLSVIGCLALALVIAAMPETAARDARAPT